MTKGVLYLEDDTDWLRGTHFKEILGKGLGVNVNWFDTVRGGLEEIAKEDFDFDDNIEFFTELWGDETGAPCEHEMIVKLSEFIDPEKIKSLTVISDNHTPGMLAGAHLIEAISHISKDFQPHEKPSLISLMSSNVAIITKDSERQGRWLAEGIDFVNKNDYAMMLLWAAHRKEINPQITFREFYLELTDFPYELNTSIYNSISDNL